ncbi:NYN domain-containing protein [Agitococcus lubricus]|uniref:NYN domain-containing protein n=1 Tax=Agitococcus lubricus TaxID=1077255 RepID=A0A2T5J0V2_9GAMM|nr:NYN domain-containing protein [Agitococcus lubricus]PTQ90017.1 NYN domain-containing protein [Agitococcus lubricus]
MGLFFLNRLQFFKRKYYLSKPDLTSEQIVLVIQQIIKKHLFNCPKNIYQHTYRIFYYDSPPLTIKVHLPLLNQGETHKRVLDFAKDKKNIQRSEILERLKKQPKFALCLGSIKHEKQWKLKDTTLNKLLREEIYFEQLSNEDFYYEMRQKGVDIKLGIDISTLAQQKLVNKIILIAGDSDFVPAAKLARIHGIDFVLDALHNNIDESLHEHIDGLVSYDLVAILKDILAVEPDIKPNWWTANTNP